MTRLSAWLVACLLALVLAVARRSPRLLRRAAHVPVEHVVVTLKQQASLCGDHGIARRSAARGDQAAPGRLDRQGIHAVSDSPGGVATDRSDHAIKRFWVFNGFAITATPAVVDALAADPAVARVTMDAARIVPAAVGPAEWNIAGSAPRRSGTWGHRAGGGRRDLDSGVDVDHPDLAGAMARRHQQLVRPVRPASDGARPT